MTTTIVFCLQQFKSKPLWIFLSKKRKVECCQNIFQQLSIVRRNLIAHGKVQENQTRVLQTLILQNTELFSECILISPLPQLYYIGVSLGHITHYN